MWWSKEDIVHLDEEKSDSSSDDSHNDDSDVPLSLSDELGSRIKSLLLSNRKADPVCCISSYDI